MTWLREYPQNAGVFNVLPLDKSTGPSHALYFVGGGVGRGGGLGLTAGRGGVGGAGLAARAGFSGFDGFDGGGATDSPYEGSDTVSRIRPMIWSTSTPSASALKFVKIRCRSTG